MIIFKLIDVATGEQVGRDIEPWKFDEFDEQRFRKLQEGREPFHSEEAYRLEKYKVTYTHLK